jgi:hypothetical protein
MTTQQGRTNSTAELLLTAAGHTTAQGSTIRARGGSTRLVLGSCAQRQGETAAALLSYQASCAEHVMRSLSTQFCGTWYAWATPASCVECGRFNHAPRDAWSHVGLSQAPTQVAMSCCGAFVNCRYGAGAPWKCTFCGGRACNTNQFLPAPNALAGRRLQAGEQDGIRSAGASTAVLR